MEEKVKKPRIKAIVNLYGSMKKMFGPIIWCLLYSGSFKKFSTKASLI